MLHGKIQKSISELFEKSKEVDSYWIKDSTFTCMTWKDTGN
jgi:hypothetical protein